jgi:hypothetical protein
MGKSSTNRWISCFFSPIPSPQASTYGWHAVECLGTLWILGGTDSGGPGGGVSATNPSRQLRENTCWARLFDTFHDDFPIKNGLSDA